MMPSVLLRPRNLAILAAAAFLLADVAMVVVALNGDFGFDFSCCYQQAGQHLLNDGATLYTWTDTYTFRYSPWAAVLFTPLAPLTAGQAVWVWFVLKVAMIGALAAWYSAPWRGNQRLGVAAMVLFFPPLWHDLVLGNVSVVTALVLLGLLRRPGPASGAVLGLLVLLAPKPHLLPVAIWVAIRRPLDAAAALAVVLVGGVVGVAAFGVDAWVAYVRTFSEPLARTFTANIGFSGLLGPPGVAVGIVAAVFILAVAVRRGDGIGLGLAVLSGIVAGPYTFIHYLAGSLVAVEPILRWRPKRLAVFPWLLVVFPLIPVWLLGLAGALSTKPPEASP